MQRPLFSLVALSLVCSLPAQLPPGSTTAKGGEEMIEWPAGIGGGTLRKAVGMFWGNVDHMSAVALNGSVAGRAQAPAITPSVTTFDVGGLPVFDCVPLPGAGLARVAGEKKRDALLLSVMGGDELRVAYMANGLPVIAPLAHAGWQRASAMAARVDGNAIDIAARSVSLTRLLRTRCDSLLGTFTQLPDIVLAEPIRDLCLVDFNEDQLHDVAVLTDSQLQIYDINGTPLLSPPLALAQPGGAIEPLPEPSLRGGMALLRRDGPLPTSGWELLRIGGGGYETPVPVSVVVPDFTLVAMTSGDLTGDGYHDVVIQDGGNKLRVVPNEAAGGPRFVAQSGLEVTVGNLGGVQSPASVRDYNYDGVADVLVPLMANNTNYLVLETGMLSRIHTTALTYDEGIFLKSYHEVDGSFTLRLDLAASSMQSFPSVTINYYSGQENAQLGNSVMATLVASAVYDVAAVDGEFPIQIPSELIDRPNLLFLTVQLHGQSEDLQKPTFLAGAMINSVTPNNAVSIFLNAHALPGLATPQIQRTISGEVGRKAIGVISAQKSLPAHID